MEPKEMQLLHEWQERLGLQDWSITLVYPCNDNEIDNDADGNVEYIESTKCAKIRIINPETRGESLRPFDFEIILVHELLHCATSLLSNEKDWETNLHQRVLHQLVDKLAIAFVDAKRKGTHE